MDGCFQVVPRALLNGRQGRKAAITEWRPRDRLREEWRDDARPRGRLSCCYYCRTAQWRRRRDSNPRSRFWPRCSLSRGVPSTSRPRLPNLTLRREAAQRDQDNNGNDYVGQIMRHIFLPHRRSAPPGRTSPCTRCMTSLRPKNHSRHHYFHATNASKRSQPPAYA